LIENKRGKLSGDLGPFLIITGFEALLVVPWEEERLKHNVDSDGKNQASRSQNSEKWGKGWG